MHWSVIDVLLATSLWFAAAAYLLLRIKTSRGRVAEHLQKMIDQISDEPNKAIEVEQEQRQWLKLLVNMGNNISLFNALQRSAMGQMMIHAGWRRPMAVSILIASKLLCGGALSMLSMLYSLPPAYDSFSMRSLLLLGTFILGMILPEYLVKWRVTTRRTAIEHALPDALDLLVICTNAGYSLAGSIQRSAIELELICPALADELGTAYGEMQLSGDNGQALRNMVDRVGTPALRSLVTTLLQSQQYGTPITQALRQLARSERTARMLRLEEQAAKLSTKITFPMVVFILPAVIMIAAGPAIINISKMIGH